MTTSVRRPDPSDFDWPAEHGLASEVRAVLDAATTADGVAPLDEAALLTLRHHGIAGSTLLTAGPVAGGPAAGGAAAGFAWLRDGSVDLVVHPEHRRHGLGRALLDEALDITRPAALTAWSHGNHPGAAALAAATGFDRVRDLWVMRLVVDGPEDLPELPDRSGSGVDVRAFRPGHDEEAFLALNAVAFSDHPEQGRLTRQDLELRLSEPWFDPAGFFVAVSTSPTSDGPGQDGELLGFHWTKVHPGEPGHGEVYVVGVSPRAQGAGLGRLLTLAGLHHLVGLGLPEVILYVEAENAPARAVYERLGFTHAAADTHVLYQHP